MIDYLGPYYGGPPFVLFSLQHILALLAVVAGCGLIAFGVPRLGPSGRSAVRWGLFGFCLANWLGWDLWQAAYGLWSPTYSLPLHLCTLSVPLSALMLAMRWRTLFEVIYFWGFTAAVVAMLTPDLVGNGYGFPHFRYWIFFTSHGVILWSATYAAAAWGYRLTRGSLLRVALISNAYLLVAGLANWLTGGNYVYIARRPEFPTLIDYLGPWPWYIIPLQLIGLAAFGLVYLPWEIADRARAARRPASA